MFLETLMSVITESYIVVIPLLVLYLLYRKNKNVYPLVVSVIVAFVIVTAIKTSVVEERPCARLDINPSFCGDPLQSFPSRHAAVVASLLIFLLEEMPLFAAFLGYAIIVCFSRVYTTAHYPDDVIVGALIGFGVGCCCLKAKPAILKCVKRFVKKTGTGRIFPV